MCPLSSSKSRWDPAVRKLEGGGKRCSALKLQRYDADPNEKITRGVCSEFRGHVLTSCITNGVDSWICQNLGRSGLDWGGDRGVKVHI